MGVLIFLVFCAAAVAYTIKKNRVDAMLGVKTKRWKIEGVGVDRLREDRSGLSLSLLSTSSDD